MNRKFNSGYDINTVLDLIDNYVDGFRSEYEWGYSIPYFLAGSYSAHVNNISYLSTKAGIASRDINYLLNRIGPAARKRYDYDLLERTYLEYQGAICDDSDALKTLNTAFAGKDILMLLPGHSVTTHTKEISRYCRDHTPVVISVNLLSQDYPIDYVYFSNKNRYQYWKNASHFSEYKKIVTSNVTTVPEQDQLIIDFTRLIKCGWDQLDNSGILLLRLLDLLDVNSIAIAGFDGYSRHSGSQNYMRKSMEKTRNTINAEEANKEIRNMLEDYMNTRNLNCPISFITPSYFESVIKGEQL